MGLALQILVIYALGCMLFMVVVMIWGLKEIMDKVPPGTRCDVFVIGIFFVILTSPFSIPVAVVKIIRTTWQEIMDRCQSLDEDHR